MARPRKRRIIHSLPKNKKFGPLDSQEINKCTYMTLDEYETIRLIDFNGFTQEECSKKMEVARTTVQSIYASARTKIAHLLINGNLLIIEGGQYHFCNDLNNCKHRRHRRRN